MVDHDDAVMFFSVVRVYKLLGDGSPCNCQQLQRSTRDKLAFGCGQCERGIACLSGERGREKRAGSACGQMHDA